MYRLKIDLEFYSNQYRVVRERRGWFRWYYDETIGFFATEKEAREAAERAKSLPVFVSVP